MRIIGIMSILQKESPLTLYVVIQTPVNTSVGGGFAGRSGKPTLQMKEAPPHLLSCEWGNIPVKILGHKDLQDCYMGQGEGGMWFPLISIGCRILLMWMGAVGM